MVARAGWAFVAWQPPPWACCLWLTSFTSRAVLAVFGVLCLWLKGDWEGRRWDEEILTVVSWTSAVSVAGWRMMGAGGRRGENRQRYNLYENRPYRFNLNTHRLPWPLMASGDLLWQLKGGCAWQEVLKMSCGASPCPQPDLPTPGQWYPTFLHVPLEYLHASSSRQSPRLWRQVLSQLLKATHLSSVCVVLEQHFIPMLEGCSEMLGGHHLQL